LNYRKTESGCNNFFSKKTIFFLKVFSKGELAGGLCGIRAGIDRFTGAMKTVTGYKLYEKESVLYALLR